MSHDRQHPTSGNAPAHFVAPWDLSRDLACIPDRPVDGTVVFVESIAKGSALPYHKKKLVFVMSAMHHFARELEAEGYDVSVVRAATYVDGITEHAKARGATKVVAMEPREWGLARAFDQAEEDGSFGVPLTRHDDGGDGGHFILRREEFAEWVEGRKAIRMVDFYKHMRKRTGYLMKDGKPIGGKWSFDAKNRKHARGQTPPKNPGHEPDALTRDWMDRIAGWSNRWGEVDGFRWAVTRVAALSDLGRFFREGAKDFGPYQDAMLLGQPYMWHALISAAMNVSLLSPREVCERVVEEHAAGRMPIESAEGLLRQILGWREFIRGMYWTRMPALRQSNLLDAARPLPNFFWAPEKTDMQCLRDSIGQVKETGYAHHIQRLMVQGNFALLAGVAPLEISHWFWASFVDAYEWVELPNVHGMAVYADDAFTTKPYAASGRYIDKMSDYCKGCPYDVKARSGEDACPFNSLFWAFMIRHRERLEQNHRLAMLYRTWDKLEKNEREATLKTAERHLASLQPAVHGWKFDDDAC